jgi:hypothetical protein
MIKPMFKIIATLLIGTILSSILFLTYNILSNQSIFNFQGNLFFIMYSCLFGLIFLGIIYYLWSSEIDIYYRNKKVVKK